ncbi:MULTISPECIES: MerR family transcriptional regulator [unclassified Microbacterium]|uniref:MerR family transcriptional regulator n=1 Tax=unclassified Microbacterium TaxID=2609290 RepID=UPI000CFBB91F|nr:MULTISPECIES: MerR family transcriptional regulator [unclassified Microbacterium]PQZ60049.1 MerR family transcriptional regulator [Microbacterium sp. MYb43]PQZ79603.1 MerR family transcriptional regulator [Microbacterium sp. MYb40]PRB23092.1 MerR family transcriptional regulator [Microbacterium sp. MYb54]PRB27629.1 MerR family transcriptional regulator [Microbacterium sp. MYb50]PRB65919.1 MerR family transcriptional regulator [Microbacterium sp. MYb24]
MLSIGAFAQIGQVTHRMLRHWDTAGLLVPAHVDQFSGYRSYDPSQLERLHRIVALRQLGFGLDDISAILDRGVDAERIASLLRIRRAEVEQEHRIAAARLVDVERRLHLIEKEKHMSQIEIIEKPLPAVRLAAIRLVVADQPAVAGVVGPAFDAVAEIIGDTHSLTTPIAEYETLDDGLQIIVGYAYAGPAREGFEIVELPAVEDAVCGIHLGSMAHISESWQAIHAEVFARGLVHDGPCRELYVRAVAEDQSDWVTELQQPVTRV